MSFIRSILALPSRRPAPPPSAAYSLWPAQDVAEWRVYRDRLLSNINRAFADQRKFPRWSGVQCEKWGPAGDDQRWLLVKIDLGSLHHTSVPMLIKPDLVQWLSRDRVVGKPVHVLDTSAALYYAIQLKPIPQQQIAAPAPAALPNLIDLPDYERPDGILPTAPGVTTAGPLVLDLAQPYHLIIGGLTQHGKTALVHALLIGLCRFASPAQLRVALVDPKGQFVHFDQLPHLFNTRATNERAALKLVSAVVDAMSDRLSKFEKVGALDLEHYNSKVDQYNATAKQDGREPLPHLPYLLLIVDEGVELSLTAGKAWMPLLTRIASRAASCGIRLIFIATSTTSDVIDTTFRQLFGVRISVKCTERMQSTKILGDSVTAAAELPNVKGRFVANLPDRGVVIGQGYYLSRDELERRAHALATQWLRDGAAAVTAPAAIALTDQQRDMIRFALGACEGYFKLREVSREFLGTLTAPAWLRQWAKELEARGLLHRPERANASRLIGSELRVSVGWPGEAESQHTTHATHSEKP